MATYDEVFPEKAALLELLERDAHMWRSLPSIFGGSLAIQMTMSSVVQGRRDAVEKALGEFFKSTEGKQLLREEAERLYGSDYEEEIDLELEPAAQFLEILVQLDPVSMARVSQRWAETYRADYVAHRAAWSASQPTEEDLARQAWAETHGLLDQIKLISGSLGAQTREVLAVQASLTSIWQRMLRNITDQPIPFSEWESAVESLSSEFDVIASAYNPVVPDMIAARDRSVEVVNQAITAYRSIMQGRQPEDLTQADLDEIRAVLLPLLSELQARKGQLETTVAGLPDAAFLPTLGEHVDEGLELPDDFTEPLPITSGDLQESGISSHQQFFSEFLQRITSAGYSGEWSEEERLIVAAAWDGLVSMVGGKQLALPIYLAEAGGQTQVVWDIPAPWGADLQGKDVDYQGLHVLLAGHFGSQISPEGIAALYDLITGRSDPESFVRNNPDLMSLFGDQISGDASSIYFDRTFGGDRLTTTITIRPFDDERLAQLAFSGTDQQLNAVVGVLQTEILEGLAARGDLSADVAEFLQPLALVGVLRDSRARDDVLRVQSGEELSQELTRAMDAAVDRIIAELTATELEIIEQGGGLSPEREQELFDVAGQASGGVRHRLSISSDGILESTTALTDFAGRDATETVVETNILTSLTGEVVQTSIQVFDRVTELLPSGKRQTRDILVQADQVGARLGSTIGNIVGGDDPFARIAAGTILEAAGRILGNAVKQSYGSAGGQSFGAALNEALDSFDEAVVAAFNTASVGAISSYLTAELVASVGAEGLGADVVNAVAYQEFSNLVTGVGDIITDGTVSADFLSGFSINPAEILGQIVVGKVYEGVDSALGFDTRDEQIGAQIGTVIGSFLPIGPLLGRAIGGLIGSLFGGGTPKSGADVAFDAESGLFEVANVWSKSGGSRKAARGIAQSAADSLNGIIATMGGTLVNGEDIEAGTYGMRKSKFTYSNESSLKRRFGGDEGAENLLNFGLYHALQDVQIAGGNTYLKRAFHSMLEQSGGASSFDFDNIIGALPFAADYGAYQENSSAINALMAFDPTSAFAAGWLITLQKARELGLDKRSASDWQGGWQVALGAYDGDATNDLSAAQLGFAVAGRERNFTISDTYGLTIGLRGDTIDSPNKDVIEGTSGNDSIAVSGDTLLDTNGLTVNGAMADGTAHNIEIAALIRGGSGDDVIRGGHLGNDLFGEGGNDTLYGGRLDDWLFGGDGDDTLYAGSDAFGLTAGDGNLLDGGADSDSLYGGVGSDWLEGGAGTDLLEGGDGDDILAGGAGGGDQVRGGLGDDTFIYRAGDGFDTVSDRGFTITRTETTTSLQQALTNGFRLDTEMRLMGITLGNIAANWAGGGMGVERGVAAGGEDTVVLGTGVGIDDIRLRRGTPASGEQESQDLLIEILDSAGNTVQRLTLDNWFDPFNRVEWLELADGQRFRIGDFSSFTVGSDGDDVLIGTAGKDFVHGGSGNDWIELLPGDDVGNGGLGADFVSGGDDRDMTIGGDGDDVLSGGAGADMVTGDGGDDQVRGDAGDDLVSGGVGSDLVVGGSGDDLFRFNRGDGHDTVFDAYSDAWETLFAGGPSGGWVSGVSFVDVDHDNDSTTGLVTQVVKDGDVLFDGTSWLGIYDYDWVSGELRRHVGPSHAQAGDSGDADTLEFAIGIDVNDLMLSSDGDDLVLGITSQGQDAIAFDALNDSIRLKEWNTAGRGIEWLSFFNTGRLRVDTLGAMAGGTDGDDSVSGTAADDWLTGNAGDDAIAGGGGVDILNGNGGQDWLSGGAGNDVLLGGSGNDTLDGGAGADQLVGGAGFDVASYASATQGVEVFLLEHPATGAENEDALYGIEGIEGSAFDDQIMGDDGDNELSGGVGNDMLVGAGGDDTYTFERGHGVDMVFDYAVDLSGLIIEQVLDSTGTLQSPFVEHWDLTATWTEDLDGGVAYRYQYRWWIENSATGEVAYDQTLIYLAPRVQPPAAYSDSAWQNGFWQTGDGEAVARSSGQPVILEGGEDSIAFGTGISLSDFTFINFGQALQISTGDGDRVGISGIHDPKMRVEFLELADGLTANLGNLLIGTSGTDADELIIGTVAADSVSGGLGRDALSGAEGDDTLMAGDGDDALEGGAGADVLHGGAGIDEARYLSSGAGVSVDLAAGTGAGGDAAGDTLTDIEVLKGSSFADTLKGNTGDNRLFGYDGDDMLDGVGGNNVVDGGLGHDTIAGGAGEDNLAGGDGNDTISGLGGNDLLDGGAGADVMNGGADDDLLLGGVGDDRLEGGTGADELVGGTGSDLLVGGLDADVLIGETGNDVLQGDAGDDVYVFRAGDGEDVIIDAAGANEIQFADVRPEQLLITRHGSDLRLTVLGGETQVTLQNYYAGGAAARRVFAGDRALYLAYAEPYIGLMAGADPMAPIVPQAAVESFSRYWHIAGKAAPVGVDQALATDEDTPLVGTVLAVDHDDDVVEYGVASQASHGTVVVDEITGQFTYTPDLNYFGPDAFTVRVFDAQGQGAESVVTVDVAPVNDAPERVDFSGAASITENQADVTLGTWSVIDVDGTPDEHTLAVDDARFEVVNHTLRLRPGFTLDHEAGETVTVNLTATDGAGASNVPTAVTFTVTDVNEAPLITDADVQIDENLPAGSMVGAVVAADPDAAGEPFGTLSFVITGGNESGLFTIDSAGVIRTTAPLDYEAAAGHSLTVEVRDRGGAAGYLAATANVSVTVNDVNEAPTDIQLAGTTISENSEGALAGALSATDPDGAFAGDFASHAFTVDDGRFFVDGLGNLRLKDGLTLDFEDEPSITVQVTATDRNGLGLTLTRPFTLTVADVVDVLEGDPGGVATPDLLVGAWNIDHIFGRGGNDTLRGLAGNDLLDGGTGNDRVEGGNNHDELLGGAGSDRLLGGAGNDALTGGDGEDLLEGESGADTLFGGFNADRLEGGAGSDELHGDGGNDMLIGGADADILDGGAGVDTASYETAASGVTVNLANSPQNTGDATGDTYISVEVIQGSTFADTLVGSIGDDELHGASGNDSIVGGAGSDRLYGGSGDDWLDAQSGDDMLDGGSGQDVLIGGTGRDVYELSRTSGYDTIMNYDPSGAEDTISYADDLGYDSLWFERAGDDLVITVVGSDASTTIQDWYLSPEAGQPGNLYKIDLFLAGERKTLAVDAEGLVDLMSALPKPTTQTEFDSAIAPVRGEFETLWGLNSPPELDPIADIADAREDTTRTVVIRAFDAETAPEQLLFGVVSSDPDVIAPGDVTFGAPDAQGFREMTITPRPDRHGVVTLTVQARAGGDQIVERSFTVAIGAAADAPSLTASNASGNQNTAIPLSVSAALADNDGSENLLIEISGVPAGALLNNGADQGDGVWRLAPSQLTGLTITPPSGSAADFTLTVKAMAVESENGDGASVTDTIDVSVNGAPSDIVFSGSVAEAAGNGTVVGDASHSDPDAGGSHAYSLVNNAGGRFAINAATGVVTLVNAGLVDFESAASHSIRVRVTDQGDLVREENFAVSVADVNETPALASRTLSVDENVAHGTDVGSVGGTDPDGGAFGTLRYYFQTSSGGISTASADGRFTIDSITGLVETNTSLNHEAQASYSYTMVTRDNAGAAGYQQDTATLTINLNNVQEAPTDVSFAGSVSEAAGNGTVVGDANHADPEGGTMVYSLTNNAGGRFAVNATTGVVMIANAGLINFESASSHQITVRVTDPAGLYRQENFTVGVTNVNEAPTLNNRTLSIAETAGVDANVGTHTGTDPDSGTFGSLRYFFRTPSGGVSGTSPDGKFTINDDTGLVEVNGALNYESASSYNYTMIARDRAGGSGYLQDTANLRINVTDVNEAPWINNATFRPRENLNPLTPVGTVSFGDNDRDSVANGQLAFSITAGNTDNYFNIDTDGRLWINNGLNYEDAGHRNFTLTVRARDRNGAGLSDTATVNVNVQNVNEIPTLEGFGYTRQATFHGGTVANFNGSDPDGNSLTYSIVGVSTFGVGVPDSFTVDQYGTVRTTESWTRQDLGSSNITVRVRDSGGLTAQKTVTVKWRPDPSYPTWPVVLDLDDDGLELTPLAESSVHFDMDADGTLDRTGWVAGDDALLALDRNGNGTIDDGSEISFIDDVNGAESDLEGLAAFDSDGNGLLDAQDERFSEFRIWQDSNQDGISQEDELRSLQAAGVMAISLTRTLTGHEVDGSIENVITATSEYLRTDGTVGLLGDVALASATNSGDGEGAAEAESSANQPQDEPAAEALDEAAAQNDLLMAIEQNSVTALETALQEPSAPEASAGAYNIAADDAYAGDSRVAQLVQAMATFGAASGSALEDADRRELSQQPMLLAPSEVAA